MKPGKMRQDTGSCALYEMYTKHSFQHDSQKVTNYNSVQRFNSKNKPTTFSLVNYTAATRHIINSWYNDNFLNLKQTKMTPKE